MDINPPKRRSWSKVNRCHCGAEKPFWAVACKPCWAKVPAAIRQEVTDLAKTARKSEAHRAAVRRAMEYVTSQPNLL